MSDLKYAFRTLTKAPWLSLVVVLSLAFGIGSNTVVFSWLKAAVLQPLPGVTAPVVLVETKDDTGNYTSTSWLEYKDLRELTPSFSLLAAQRPRALYLGDSERETRVFAEMVSENFFGALGVAPQLGRFFRPEEVAHPGSAPVAVISHDFWQHYFKGAPDVVGQPLKLKQPHADGDRCDTLWLPRRLQQPRVRCLRAADDEHRADCRHERAAAAQQPALRHARALKPGVTLGQARGETGGRGEALSSRRIPTRTRASPMKFCRSGAHRAAATPSSRRLRRCRCSRCSS